MTMSKNTVDGWRWRRNTESFSADGYVQVEEEPTVKRRLSMIDMLRNPYEGFDDVARQDWRTAVQGYFDVMNKVRHRCFRVPSMGG
jgi:hypothetical protein